MASVSELTTRLEALKAARDSGALIVRHGDTQTTYRSLDEIERTIARITAEINAASGTTRKPRYVRQTRKGH